MFTKIKDLEIGTGKNCDINLESANNQTPIVITKTRDSGFTVLDTANDKLYLCKTLTAKKECKMVCVNSTYYSEFGKYQFSLNKNKGKDCSPGTLKIKTKTKKGKKEITELKEKACPTGFVYIITAR